MTSLSAWADSADLPVVQPPDIPNWVENFWWLGFDQSNQTGVMMHLASLPHDFGLIRQTVLVYLPDGSLLADLSIGRRHAGPGVVAASAGAHCDQPFQQWSLHLDGMLERTSIDSMWAGPVQHGPRIPVRIEATATAAGPPWSPDTHSRQQATAVDWAREHYQQPVRISGTVTVNSEDVPLDCIGVRDHSRGPRNMTAWSGHCLLSAVFPSGRSAGVMIIYGADGTPVLNEGYIQEDGALHSARITLAPPMLSGAALEREQFRVILDSDGTTHSLDVETATPGSQRSFLTMLPPNDVVLGLLRNDPASIALGWTAGMYSLDGEPGYGPVERSKSLATL